MQLSVFDFTGKQIDKINLKKDTFDGKVNDVLLAQAIRVYQSNQRADSSKVKTRSEVKLTTRKVYRQKGTGNARHGSKRAPIFVGGGMAHGPKLEQNSRLNMSKKMRKAALKSALNLLINNKKIFLVTGFESLKTPKTKIAVSLLESLGISENSVNVFTDKSQDVVKKIMRNLVNTDVFNIENINVFSLLNSKNVVFTKQAFIKVVENL